MKTCTKCGETKPKSEFNRDSRSKDCHYCWCRNCSKANDKQRHIENPNRYKKYALKKRYGISLEEYTDMYNNQNGCCAICGRHNDTFAKSLAVDHCHITGKVRKLLCINCNSAIGKLQDDIEILQKAISYLKEHNE